MDQTKIWEYFQNDDGVGDAFAGALTRYEFLAKKIKASSSILNVGVGRGGLEQILINQGVMVSSLDPSESSIESLRNNYNLGERAQVGFSQAMPFSDNQFDVVIMSEVVEHLSEDVIGLTMSEVSRVLKSKGLFIGTVPAEENLQANLAMCPHCGESFHRWGHLQAFSKNRLEQTLSEAFNQVSITRHFFGDARLLNWKGRISLTIKKLMLSLGVNGSGETYFFSAQKK